MTMHPSRSLRVVRDDDPPGDSRPGETEHAESRPNLFIVGAPKSGTTWLAHCLFSHPELYVAPRELHHFGSDLEFRTRRGAPWRISREAYCGWFRGQQAKLYRADRSVFYLYSRRAAGEIRRFDPTSRIVAMLRDPVSQMHAEHGEMVFQGEEDLEDFAEALDAEPDRLAGRRLPRGVQHAVGLYYRALARYAEQLERYLAAFGSEQVHVVIHDDLVADPAATYRGVLEFLGVDPGHRPDLRVVNGSKAARYATLRRALHSDAPALLRLERMLVPSAGARARLRGRLQSWNTVRRPRPPLDPGLAAALRQELDPEVQRLEALLGRALPAWRAPGAGPSPRT